MNVADLYRRLMDLEAQVAALTPRRRIETVLPLQLDELADGTVLSLAEATLDLGKTEPVVEDEWICLAVQDPCNGETKYVNVPSGWLQDQPCSQCLPDSGSGPGSGCAVCSVLCVCNNLCYQTSLPGLTDSGVCAGVAAMLHFTTPMYFVVGGLWASDPVGNCGTGYWGAARLVMDVYGGTSANQCIADVYVEVFSKIEGRFLTVAVYSNANVVDWNCTAAITLSGGAVDSGYPQPFANYPATISVQACGGSGSGSGSGSGGGGGGSCFGCSGTLAVTATGKTGDFTTLASSFTAVCVGGTHWVYSASPWGISIAAGCGPQSAISIQNTSTGHNWAANSSSCACPPYAIVFNISDANGTVTLTCVGT